METHTEATPAPTFEALPWPRPGAVSNARAIGYNGGMAAPSHSVFNPPNQLRAPSFSNHDIAIELGAALADEREDLFLRHQEKARELSQSAGDPPHAFGPGQNPRLDQRHLLVPCHRKEDAQGRTGLARRRRTP